MVAYLGTYTDMLCGFRLPAMVVNVTAVDSLVITDNYMAGVRPIIHSDIQTERAACCA